MSCGVWLRVEKWRNEKLFCLVEKKKNERIKFEIFINLLSCFYYIENNFNSCKKQQKSTLERYLKAEKKKRKKERTNEGREKRGKWVNSHLSPSFSLIFSPIWEYTKITPKGGLEEQTPTSY